MNPLFRQFSRQSRFQRTIFTAVARSRPSPWALMAGGALLAVALTPRRKVECAPAKQKDFTTSIFTPKQGAIPIPALVMLKHIQEDFARDFPEWELPATFTRQMDYYYEETGALNFVWPAGAWIKVPIFPRLTEAEEKQLGESGQRKQPVATCYVRGVCRAACAEIHIVEVKIEDAKTGQVLWSLIVPGQ